MIIYFYVKVSVVFLDLEHFFVRSHPTCDLSLVCKGLYGASGALRGMQSIDNCILMTRFNSRRLVQISVGYFVFFFHSNIRNMGRIATFTDIFQFYIHLRDV